MKVHKVSEPKEWAVDMGSGSQDCMHLFFSATLNDGDYVLLDAPSYPVSLLGRPLSVAALRSQRGGFVRGHAAIGHDGHVGRIQRQLCRSAQR